MKSEVRLLKEKKKDQIRNEKLRKEIISVIVVREEERSKER
jgi:hypothetical protein